MVDGWFYETDTMWPGQRFGLKVKAVVHAERTAFQDVLIFDAESYGRVLVLDGVIQCSTRDEVWPVRRRLNLILQQLLSSFVCVCVCGRLPVRSSPTRR